MAETSEFLRHPGDRAAPFDLRGTDGRRHTLHEFDGSSHLLVTFWCNHCPYVQGWESRLIDLARRYQPQGVAFVVVNSNDARQYPDDRFERMVERAQEKHYPFPYLWDESQEVARAYGALVTPHPMLFGPKRTLLFQGRIDDQPKEPSMVRERFLEEALEAALAGRPIPRSELAVLGCSVKWRSD
ncbi:MAG TPA: thioredoxin family protein [Thermoplasmata archaeon]|nr:thioredoxin family protein [Thermoplasmata archaeon]